MAARSNRDGYILKNFQYHESLRFNDDNADEPLAVAAVAPNCGGRGSQNPRALFYEQEVRFFEGPATDQVVHVKNAAWLASPCFVQ